jgi:hypothetical protein
LRAASVVRQMAQELRLSRRPARIRGRHRRPAIGERAAAAIRVQTSPSINPELDPNRLALSEKSSIRRRLQPCHCLKGVPHSGQMPFGAGLPNTIHAPVSVWRTSPTSTLLAGAQCFCDAKT